MVIVKTKLELTLYTLLSPLQERQQIDVTHKMLESQ